MNNYILSVFHQIKVAIDSVIEIINQFPEAELESKPINNKRSYLELLSHISLLCKADLLILNEASQKEMEIYYERNKPETIEELKEHLLKNFNELVKEFSSYSDEKLFEYTKSYWGVCYSRYEWLLEILSHLYHHRSQLHSYLLIDSKKIKVQLFE